VLPSQLPKLQERGGGDGGGVGVGSDLFGPVICYITVCKKDKKKYDTVKMPISMLCVKGHAFLLSLKASGI